MGPVRATVDEDITEYLAGIVRCGDALFVLGCGAAASNTDAMREQRERREDGAMFQIQCHIPSVVLPLTESNTVGRGYNPQLHAAAAPEGRDPYLGVT